MEGASEHQETTSVAVGSGGLHGKVCIITGSNTGIGKETALAMAALGAHVVMACRSVEKAEAAIVDIRKEIEETLEKRQKSDHEKEWTTFGLPQIRNAGDVSLEAMALDLSDLASVRAFVGTFLEKHQQLHYLILNAGVVTTEKRTSAQGHELMFATNHLGHFFLTTLLLDTLAASSPARIVVVSSLAHKFCGPLNEDLQLVANPPAFGLSTSMSMYGVSKLCNLLFTLHLAKLLKEKGSGVTVNAVHPGAVDTDLGRETPWYLAWIVKPVSRLFFRTAADGAKTSVYCAVAPEVDGVSGKYFSNEREDTPKSYALDETVAAGLWAFSEDLVRDF
jgi:retinol dehydrogenase-12